MLTGLLGEPPLTLLLAAIAVVLPTFFGMAVLRLTLNRNQLCFAALVGHGFFIGHCLITVILRAIGAPNKQVDVSLAISLVAGLTALAIALLVWRRLKTDHQASIRPETSIQMGFASHALLTLIFSLVAIKQGLILNEVVTRPLWAWDAIDTWTKRAQDWYILSDSQYFTYSLNENTWTSGPWVESLGNYPHPFTTNLISLWGMIVIGTHNTPATNIAWAFAPLAISLMVYGYLADQRHPRLLCVTAGYFIFSMPYTGVHAGLPGYADLWLAGFLTSVVLLTSQGLKKRSLAFLAPALIAVLGVLTSKRTGIVLTGLSMPYVLMATIYDSDIGIRTRLAYGQLRIGPVALGITVLSCLIFLLVWVAGFGDSLDTILMSNRLQFDAHNIFGPLAESFFYQSNWHFAGMLFSIIFMFSLCTPKNENIAARSSFPFLEATTLTLLIIIISTYTFSAKYFAQAENMTTLNRSLMLITPLLLVWAMDLVGRRSLQLFANKKN